MTMLTSPAVPAMPLARDGVVSGVPRIVLRVEGAIVLAASTFAYAKLDGHWLVFALLFFAPDLSMLGYFAGRRIGAISYNLGHSYGLPAALGAMGVLSGRHILWALALIWVAHIGLDRMFGYGLKYVTAFGVTHLGLHGKAKSKKGDVRDVSADQVQSGARA